MREKTVGRVVAAAVLACVVATPGVATAKDAIRAGVTIPAIPAGEPVPIITETAADTRRAPTPSARSC